MMRRMVIGTTGIELLMAKMASIFASSRRQEKGLWRHETCSGWDRPGAESFAGRSWDSIYYYFFQWLSWHWAIHYILYCMVHLNKDMEALLLGVPLLGMMIDYVKWSKWLVYVTRQMMFPLKEGIVHSPTIAIFIYPRPTWRFGVER